MGSHWKWMTWCDLCFKCRMDWGVWGWVLEVRVELEDGYYSCLGGKMVFFKAKFTYEILYDVYSFIWVFQNQFMLIEATCLRYLNLPPCLTQTILLSGLVLWHCLLKKKKKKLFLPGLNVWRSSYDRKLICYLRSVILYKSYMFSNSFLFFDFFCCNPRKTLFPNRIWLKKTVL